MDTEEVGMSCRVEKHIKTAIPIAENNEEQTERRRKANSFLISTP